MTAHGGLSGARKMLLLLLTAAALLASSASPGSPTADGAERAISRAATNTTIHVGGPIFTVRLATRAVYAYRLTQLICIRARTHQTPLSIFCMENHA